MINTILKKAYSNFVGEGLRALPSDGENFINSDLANHGQAQRPVPTSILLFFCLLLFLPACTKQPESKTTATEETQAVNSEIEIDELFPVPELSNDNIKDVNELLMEELRQGLIDESREDGEQLEDFIVSGVETPELEIEIELPNMDELLWGPSGPTFLSGSEPNLLVMVPPKYPSNVTPLVEGYVELEYIVDESGNVIETKVINSDLDKRFQRNARRALLKWKFKPKVDKGKAIKQTLRRKIEFSFKD